MWKYEYPIIKVTELAFLPKGVIWYSFFLCKWGDLGGYMRKNGLIPCTVQDRGAIDVDINRLVDKKLVWRS